MRRYVLTRDARDLLLPGTAFGGFGKLSFDTNSETFTTSAAAYGTQNGFEFLGYLNWGNGDNHTDGDGREVIGTETDFLSGIGKLAYEADEGHRFELSHDRVKDDAPRPFRANIGSLTNRPGDVIRDYTLERQNTVFTYTDAETMERTMRSCCGGSRGP